MYFNGLRLLVGSVYQDVPIGSFADGQVMQYDAPNNVLRGGPAFAGGFGADDIGVWNGTAFVPKQHSVRRVTGVSQSTSSTSYVNITNLDVTINRTGLITFDYFIFYATNVATEGIGLQLAFTGTHDGGLGYAIDMFTAPNVRADLISQSTFGAGIAPQTTGPGPTAVQAIIRGSCNVTGVGVLSCQMRAETGGANSVFAFVGSWARVFAQ